MHRWDCPTESEARRRARHDATNDARDGFQRNTRPFRDCEDADRRYRREYDNAYYDERRRIEDEQERARAEERRAEQRRRDEQRRQEERWRQEQEQEEYERYLEEQAAGEAQAEQDRQSGS